MLHTGPLSKLDMTSKSSSQPQTQAEKVAFTQLETFFKKVSMHPPVYLLYIYVAKIDEQVFRVETWAIQPTRLPRFMLGDTTFASN